MLINFCPPFIGPFLVELIQRTVLFLKLGGMLPDEIVVHFAGKLIFFFCVCLAGSIFCACLAGIEIAALRMSRTPSGE